MLLKKTKVWALLLVVFVITSCQKKSKEIPDEFQAPEVRIISSNTGGSIKKPIKSIDEFYIGIATTASIYLSKSDSFCLDPDGNKVNIVDDNLEKQTFNPGDSPQIKLFLPDDIINNPEIRLDNCQVGWKYRKSQDESVKIISLGAVYYDGLIPKVELTVPSSGGSTGNVSFFDINSGSFSIKAKPNKDVFISNRSTCVVVQTDSLKANQDNDIKVNTGTLSEPIRGQAQATTNCEVIFQDRSGRSTTETFDIVVDKPTFSASLDSKVYNYSPQANNSGRGTLTADSDQEGNIICRTDIRGLNCLGGSIKIEKGVQLIQPLATMALGVDNYRFLYTPKGAKVGGGWSTEVAVANIEFKAQFNLESKLPLYGNTGTNVKHVYFNVPEIALKAVGVDGKVNFSAGTNGTCPEYDDDIELQKNVEKNTPTTKNGRDLNLDYLPDSENVMSCLVTLSVTSPADLAGSEITNILSFTIDKKPPLVTVNQNPISTTIDKAGTVTAEFTVSEEVVVEQDSCDAANEGKVVNSKKNKLNYDFSGNNANTACRVTFKDYTLDVVQSVDVDFNVSVKGPQVFSFDGNVADGSRFFARQTGEAEFTSDTNGYIFCENLADPADLVNNEKNCFQTPYVTITVPAGSDEATSTFKLTNLSSGKHDYKFTLLPSPPYTPQDLDQAQHKAEITETIEANRNPLTFTATPTGPLRNDEQTLTLQLSEAGKISYAANSGGNCPVFDPANIEFTTSGSKEIKMDFSGFTSGFTVIDCTLTLTTLTTPSEDKDATISFNIDKEKPIFNVNSLLSNQALPNESILNVNNFASTSRSFSITANMSENGTVSSRCLGNPNVSGKEQFDDAIGLSKSVEINFSGIRKNSNISPNDPNNSIYSCIFDSQDASGNVGDKYTLHLEYSSPEIIFTPQDPNNILEYSFPDPKSPSVHRIEVASPVDAQKITCKTTESPVKVCGEVPSAGVLGANVKQDMILSNLSVGSKQYRFELIDKAGKVIDTKLVNISFSNDIGFKVFGPDIGDVLNNFNTNGQIQYTTEVEGRLSIRKPAGATCFTLRNQSQGYVGPFVNRTNLIVDLPQSCDTQCNISCTLVFSERQQPGLNSQREDSHYFSFSIDKRGIGLADFAPGAGRVVDVGAVDFSMNFQVAVSVTASRDKITVNKYRPAGEVLYTFEDSDLSIDNNNTRLNFKITDRDKFIRELLKTNRAYIRIPKGKIMPESGSGLGFNGICETCDAKIDVSNFYVAVKMSKLYNLGNWSVTPRNTITKYDEEIYIKCGDATKTYCIGTPSGSLTGINKLQVKKSSTNGQNNSQNIVESASFDPGNNQIAFEHNGFETSGDYYITYEDTVDLGRNYNDLASNHLNTESGAIVIFDMGERMKVKYEFTGIAKITGKKLSAAYGMRLLNKDYTGNILQVVVLEDEKNKNYSNATKYNIKAYPFDEQDKSVSSYEKGSSGSKNLVNVAGSLNLEELNEKMRASGAKYFGVYKWYDQSGNQRHIQQQDQSNLPIVWIKDSSDIRSYGNYNYFKASNAKERRPTMLFINSGYSGRGDAKNFVTPFLGNKDRNLWEYLGKNGSRNQLEGTVVSVATHNTGSRGRFAWGFTSTESQLAEILDLEKSSWLFGNRKGKVTASCSTPQRAARDKNLVIHASDISLKTSGRSHLIFEPTIHYWQGSDIEECRISSIPSNKKVRIDIDLTSKLYVGGYSSRNQPSSRVTNRFFSDRARTPGTAISEILIFNENLSDKDKKIVLKNQADYYLK